MKGHRLIPWIILAVGALVYCNSVSGVFLLDDRAVANLPRILANEGLWKRLVTSARPLVALSLALNGWVTGAGPWGYHAFNVGVHLLAALALYGVVRRTLLLPYFHGRYEKKAFGLAIAIVLVWMVHPLQTESVTYIVQRAESMMGFFYLGSLYCLIRSVDSPAPGRWCKGSVSFCALGMATKPVMVTAPLVLLVYDKVFLCASFREALRRRWAFYLGLAATWGILVVLLCLPHESTMSTGFGMKDRTWLEYLATQPGVILHYLRLCFWPGALCLDYWWPIASSLHDVRGVLAPGLLILALLTATAWGLRYFPSFGFLGVWFFLILAPTSSIIPIADAAFEHRMYIPLGAVVSATVMGFDAMLPRFLKGFLDERWRKGLAWMLLVLVVVMLGYQTICRNEDYGSEYRMWSKVVAQRPQNPRANYALANILAQEGKTEEARSHFLRALQLEPRFAAAHYNLGVLFQKEGKNQDAIFHYTETLRINHKDADAHNNLGLILLGQGDGLQAVAHFREAIKIRPDHAQARINLLKIKSKD